jgi:hypothetical protein
MLRKIKNKLNIFIKNVSNKLGILRQCFNNQVGAVSKFRHCAKLKHILQLFGVDNHQRQQNIEARALNPGETALR